MTLRREGACWLSLIMLCAVAFWNGLGRLGVTDLDEGLYAAAAREVALSGDIVTPRVNGEAFFEKPPLLYWLAGLSLRVFGVHETALRLPSALAATLTVLLTFWFGRRRLGERSAWLGAAFLALSPVFVAAGRLATTDALLVLLITLSLISAFEAVVAPGWVRLRWLAMAGVWSGVGVLAKGVVALVLPLLITGAWLLWVHRGRLAGIARWRTFGYVVLFVALAGCVAGPWHVAAWRANGPVFTNEYIVRQHIQRFRGGDRSHRAPVWFFVPAFLVGFFPWSAFAVPALVLRRREPTLQRGWDADNAAPSTATSPDSGSPDTSFLRIWFWVTFLLFSASGSKLVSYILPLYPAAALLAGAWAGEVVDRGRTVRSFSVGIAIAGGILVLLWLAVLWPDPLVQLVNRYTDRPIAIHASERELLVRAVPLLLVTSLTILAAGMASIIGKCRLSVMAAITGMAAFLLVAVAYGLPVLQQAAIGSLHRMTREACSAVGPRGQVVIAVGPPRRPSVLFYVPSALLQRRRIREIPSLRVRDTRLVAGSVVLARSELLPPEHRWALLRRSAGFSLWQVQQSAPRSTSGRRRP